jgi:hypothetical protein
VALVLLTPIKLCLMGKSVFFPGPLASPKSSFSRAGISFSARRSAWRGCQVESDRAYVWMGSH